MRNQHKILIGMSEGKTPLESSKRRQEDNIRMDFIDIWWEGVDWIHLAQDYSDHWQALVNAVMKLPVP
jgi:hypothetical protein